MYLKAYASDYLKHYETNLAVEYKQIQDLLNEVIALTWNACKNTRYERNQAILINVMLNLLTLKTSMLVDTSMLNKVSEYLSSLKAKPTTAMLVPDTATADTTDTDSETDERQPGEADERQPGDPISVSEQEEPTSGE